MPFYPQHHPFATLLRSPTWLKAQILLVGRYWPRANAPWLRRYASLSDDRNYARYHQVIGRCGRPVRRLASCSCRQHLDQGELDLHLWSDVAVKSLGIYLRCRSSRSQVVKASGLRVLMWLGQVPWAGLLGLALSHCAGALGTLPPAARTPPQKTFRLGPADDPATAPLAERPLVLVGDGGRRPRPAPLLPIVGAKVLRLDAALYEPAPPRQPGRNGRPPLKGRRLPALKSLDHPGHFLDHRRGSLVQRRDPHGGRKRRSYRSGKPPVPLLGSGPPGRITGSAVH